MSVPGLTFGIGLKYEHAAPSRTRPASLASLASLAERTKTVMRPLTT